MSGLITVAGGVIAVYIIFALISAHIVEYIDGFVNSRGTLLYKGILEMLSGTKDGKPLTGGVGGQVTEAIYSHPLVGNLGMKQKPSYIAARTFTLTLVAALQDVVRPGTAKPGLNALPSQLLDDLRARVTGLGTTDNLGRSLGLILEQTENRYDAALRAIDTWYENQMDRITGTYKRNTAVVQMIVAAVVVILFNVDTFGIVKQLAASGTAAQALGAAAQGVKLDASVADQLNVLMKAGLQVGWVGGPHIPTLEQVGGWVISWFAVLLGAPFWFDVLKRIVPVRLSGTIPDADAASKGDKQAART